MHYTHWSVCQHRTGTTYVLCLPAGCSSSGDWVGWVDKSPAVEKYSSQSSSTFRTVTVFSNSLSLSQPPKIHRDHQSILPERVCGPCCNIGSRSIELSVHIATPHMSIESPPRIKDYFFTVFSKDIRMQYSTEKKKHSVRSETKMQWKCHYYSAVCSVKSLSRLKTNIYKKKKTRRLDINSVWTVCVYSRWHWDYSYKSKTTFQLYNAIQNVGKHFWTTVVLRSLRVLKVNNCNYFDAAGVALAELLFMPL